MANIYALFIAINHYQRSEIGNLEGCVNDAESVAAWLQTQTKSEGGRLSIYRLYSGGSIAGNALPTRANLIATLQAYAGKLKKDDTFFLYYSGHGGKEMAAPFFGSPTGLLSTLVPCDSGVIQPNGRPTFDLLSIELRQLLYNIWQQGEPNILFIQDSCHSERSTRMFGVRQSQEEKLNGLLKREPKQNLLLTQTRQPAEYNLFPAEIQSAIARSSASTRSFTPTNAQNSFAALSPQAEHTHLAACTFEQYAYENVDSQTGSSGGIFTRTLLQILQETRGRISYAELANRLRYSIDGVFKQTPNLYFHSAQTRRNIGWEQRQFLGEELLAEGDQYALICRPLQDGKSQWLAAAGALQGLQLMRADEVWQTEATHKSSGAKISAKITYVGANCSLVELAQAPAHTEGWQIRIEGKHFQRTRVGIRFVQAEKTPSERLVELLAQISSQDFAVAASADTANFTIALAANYSSLRAESKGVSFAVPLKNYSLSDTNEALQMASWALIDRAESEGIALPLRLWAAAAENSETKESSELPALYPDFDWKAEKPQYILSFDGNQYELQHPNGARIGSSCDRVEVAAWLDKIQRYQRCLMLYNQHPERLRRFEDYRFQLSADPAPNPLSLQAGNEWQISKTAFTLQNSMVTWKMLNQYTGGLSADNATTFYIGALWLGADLEIAQVAPSTPFAPNHKDGAQPLGLPFALPARSEGAPLRRGYLKLLLSFRPFATHQYLQEGIHLPQAEIIHRSHPLQRGELASDWLAFTLAVDY